MTDPLQIWTIGHSNRELEDLIAMLQANRIEVVADVRSLPGSRTYPRFNSEVLSLSLKNAGIEYRHFRELGGRRRSKKHSKNTVWRNASFRGYADYMETQEFADAAEDLLDTARSKRTAVMCAEAVWWRCHRSMIADYLKASGVEVVHILSPTKTEIHPYTSAARIENGKLTYRESGCPE